MREDAPECEAAQSTREVLDLADAESAPTDINGAPRYDPQHETTSGHAAKLQLAIDALTALDAGDIAAGKTLLAQLVYALTERTR